MDLTKFWIFIVFVVCLEQTSVANNVNVLNKNHPGRSRPKKSVDTKIYLAIPPADSIKAGKQENPSTLIRLDYNSPSKYKGKFPTPIERFIQRIQNYFSVYNPPEYLNDLRPGYNNPENEEDQDINHLNDTQIILPCNGTSTIVIIPVPVENENVFTNTNSDKPEGYQVAMKPNFTSDATIPTNPETVPYKPIYSYEVTTIKPTYTEATTPQFVPYAEGITTPKPKCPEITTPKLKYPDVTTPKPKCPEVTTPKPECPEVTTTPKPKCPEVTTSKPECPETTTPPKPKCPEVTTPKPDCPDVTTQIRNCPEVTTPKSKCPEATTQKPPCPPKQLTSSSDPKPISGYGSNEVPPLNLVAQPVLGSTVIYFYKHPSTLPSNSPSYYIPSTPAPNVEHTHKPKPPMLRLKQLLFPRLYAAFHPDE